MNLATFYWHLELDAKCRQNIVDEGHRNGPMKLMVGQRQWKQHLKWAEIGQRQTENMKICETLNFDREFQ